MTQLPNPNDQNVLAQHGAAVPEIPFDTFTLAAVAHELRTALVGAFVQKIYQPSPNELVLNLYGGKTGGASRVLLCADPRLFRVHLTEARRPNPQTPPAFCSLCRKYLEQAEVLDFRLPRFDRILHITFRAEDGEKFLLTVELMGRNANIALVSGAGIVRGTIRPAPPEGERVLRSPLPYALPPEDSRRDPLTVTNEDALWADLPKDEPTVTAWLASTFSGMGRFAAEEIRLRGDTTPGGVRAAFLAVLDDTRRESFAPHAVADNEGATVGVWAFTPMSAPPARSVPLETLSGALEEVYTVRALGGAEQSERASLARLIARETQFRRKELASARNTLAEAARADDHERTGNNLLAALHLIERGASVVIVPDLYAPDGREITVALDPKKTPQENAQAYFERARKARDAGEYAEGKQADLEEELSQLDELTQLLQTADSPDDYAHIRAGVAHIIGEARAQAAFGDKPAARPKHKPFDGHKVRTYTVNGYELLVGESAEANDYLVTRAAAPSDWWFHVRATTGAHGVLRTNGQPLRVPDTALIRAAEIVAARSHNVKHAGIVAVDVAQKRYVRKPRGAKPGTVTYERERTLDVVPKL